MTNDPGIYALVIWIERESTIELGRFGTHVFTPGWYVYVGSAYGPGGLKARTDRHRRREKRKHWHVDYLLEHAQIVEIWFSHDISVREHDWAQAFACTPGAIVPARGFGSQDCKAGCPSHLIGFPFRPVAHTLRFDMKRRDPSHKPVYVEFVAPWKQVIEGHYQSSSVFDSYLHGRVYLERRRRATYDKLENVQSQKRLTIMGDNRIGAQLITDLASELEVKEKALLKDARFAECVDEIIDNCGDDGYRACFRSRLPQSRKGIEQISRTSDVRQRYRVDGVNDERFRSVKPQSDDPVYDTVAFKEVHSRLRRARGALVTLNGLLGGQRDGAVRMETLRLLKMCGKSARFLARFVRGELRGAASIPKDLRREAVTVAVEQSVVTGRIVGFARLALKLTIKSLWDYPEMRRRKILPTPEERLVSEREILKIEQLVDDAT